MQRRRKTPISLNVYDLVEQNSWVYWCGVGIYHSGVEVHGVEYAYGGHDEDAPGVFATAPREAPGSGEPPAAGRHRAPPLLYGCQPGLTYSAGSGGAQRREPFSGRQTP